MRIYKTNKIVLSVKGDYEKFMQGLSSNTLDAKRNAFLDKFGRIVGTFDQIKLNGELLIIIEPQFYERVTEHLSKYIKISKVRIDQTKKIAWWNLENGESCVGDDDVESNISEEEFNEWRLVNNIPTQGKDYDREMILNVSEDFVSFSKGCYLGQEIVAKVKHKGKAPKKLVVKNGKFVFVVNESLPA